MRIHCFASTIICLRNPHPCPPLCYYTRHTAPSLTSTFIPIFPFSHFPFCIYILSSSTPWVTNPSAEKTNERNKILNHVPSCYSLFRFPNILLNDDQPNAAITPTALPRYVEIMQEIGQTCRLTLRVWDREPGVKWISQIVPANPAPNQGVKQWRLSTRRIMYRSPESMRIFRSLCSG